MLGNAWRCLAMLGKHFEDKVLIVSLIDCGVSGLQLGSSDD